MCRNQPKGGCRGGRRGDNFPHRFAPCFRIIREEGKYKRLRNADKFQARVSKIRKALAETSTRPVTFHEEVCLGGDE